MKLELLALFAICCVYAAAETPEWKHFKSHHNKNFDNTVKESRRQRQFQKALDRIKSHNKLFDAGQVTFKLSVNRFTDLPHGEFVQRLNGYRQRKNAEKKFRKVANVTKLKSVVVPASMDWRTKGAVTRVKNQLTCGSCWTFATAAVVESHNFIKNKVLVELSEQNILDCTGNDNSCDGGNAYYALDYIARNGGIDKGAYYPYDNEVRYCRYQSAYKGASISSYVELPAGDENALKKAVGTIGPIAVAIDADPVTFQYYKSGVYYDPSCSSLNLNHAVTLVGYGTENGQDYWLIKNSWGETWGDRGYVKIARNRANHCGVATECIYPVI